MNDKENTESNAGDWIIAIIVLIIVGWLIHRIYNNYINGEKKPFWKGTEEVQVCKKPYYSSRECYQLPVALIDEKTARVFFPNGGYVVTEDVTCYFAGTFLSGAPRYTFCQSWDDEGNQWDFLPIWINF